MAHDTPNVGLLVTCLADLFRPSVARAAVVLLRRAGCRVHVPAQTCCGQPAYNAGARTEAKRIARGVIERFEGFDHVIVPSGSCAGMLARHYPALFRDEPRWATRAERLARRSFELTAFLVDARGVARGEGRFPATVTYHDACAGLRELEVERQPRALLAGIEGLELRELGAAEECCGFGGTFCVKYADISLDITDRKIDEVVETGADVLLAGDLGCLMNLAGRLKRRGERIEVRHVAEVLAGITAEVAPIAGEGDA